MTQLAEPECRQRQDSHSQREYQCQSIRGVLGRLAQPVKNPLTDSRRDNRQEHREAKVDHAFVVHPRRRSAHKSATQNCEASGSRSIGIGPDSTKVMPWARYQAAVS